VKKAVDADGTVDAQTAPTAPWKSLRDSHKRPPPVVVCAVFREDDEPRLRAASKSDDTDGPYRVAGFQTFFGGRISTFGDTHRRPVIGPAMTGDRSLNDQRSRDRRGVIGPRRSVITRLAPCDRPLATADLAIDRQ
jgi:hypothetical protein